MEDLGRRSGSSHEWRQAISRQLISVKRKQIGARGVEESERNDGLFTGFESKAKCLVSHAASTGNQGDGCALDCFD